jgi:hypothetical protein
MLQRNIRYDDELHPSLYYISHDLGAFAHRYGVIVTP